MPCNATEHAIKPLLRLEAIISSTPSAMLNYIGDCRVILFVLGLLPSVIVNLSTNYHHHTTDSTETDLSRILPGDGNKDYQIESPLLNHHQEEEASNGIEGATSPTLQDTSYRYQLVGLSQPNGLNEGFVTKSAQSDRPKKGGNRRWINKLGKGAIKRKIADQDILPKKLALGYENKDQLLMDDNYRVDNPKKPHHDSKFMVDGLRSGYYFDSYGDWHHNGGGDHTSTAGTWTNGLGLADVGSGYISGVSNGHSHGSGYNLVSWHLLNPLILVALLSFVISLINAVLGLVDKVKLPLARERRIRPPEYSRVVDGEFLEELEKLYDSIQYGQKHV